MNTSENKEPQKYYYIFKKNGWNWHTAIILKTKEAVHVSKNASYNYVSALINILIEGVR